MDPDLANAKQFYGEQIRGITRTDMLRRLRQDFGYLLEQKYTTKLVARSVETEEEQKPEMVIKVNLQEALNRALYCPVCGIFLLTYPDYPQEKSCPAGCGDFTVTDVYGNGDVILAFKMVAPEGPVDDQHDDS